MAMWPSWPQACILPGCSLANAAPERSVTGRASMSVRMAVACSLPRLKRQHRVDRQGEKTEMRLSAAASGCSTERT